MILGVMITACTIANLQLLMTNLDAALTSFQNKLELLKVYMAFRKLPDILQQKIISYYDHQWYLLKGTNEQEVGSKFLHSLNTYLTLLLSPKSFSTNYHAQFKSKSSTSCIEI